MQSSKTTADKKTETTEKEPPGAPAGNNINANNDTDIVTSLVDRMTCFLNAVNDPPSSYSYDDIKHIPFMNLLDSMAIQELHRLLESELHEEISPVFLFQYPTLSKVRDYLINHRQRYHPSKEPAANNDTDIVTSLVDRMTCFLNAVNDPPSSYSYDDIKHIPFMNLLDSMAIQELHRLLESELHEEISPVFLFQYPTLSKVRDYLLTNIMNQNDTNNGIKINTTIIVLFYYILK